MPRTALAVTEVAFLGSAAMNLVAVDAVNGNMFPNDGRTVLVVKNGGASAITLTVRSVPDEYGRSGDIVASMAAGEQRIVGPLRPGLFNQKSGTDQGQVYVDYSAGASVTAGAFRLNS